MLNVEKMFVCNEGDIIHAMVNELGIEWNDVIKKMQRADFYPFDGSNYVIYYLEDKEDANNEIDSIIYSLMEKQEINKLMVTIG